IGGKMFAYADMVDFGRFSVKCDPDEAILLRDQHSEITPGFHMNKRHWNTIATTGDLPDAFLRAQIRNSYRLVLCGVTPRTLRDEITAYLQKVGLPSVDPSTASEIAEEAP
ncbi:MAG: MmcQ/YjbR family DNA-binding protein, partial [Alistipes sp.]